MKNEKKQKKASEPIRTLELAELEAVTGGYSRRRRAGRHAN